MTTTDGAGALTQRIRRQHADRLKAVRNQAGMTREQLAQQVRDLGFEATASAVVQWELAKASPRWATSVAICQVLEVVWSDIFGLDGVTL